MTRTTIILLLFVFYVIDCRCQTTNSFQKDLMNKGVEGVAEDIVKANKAYPINHDPRLMDLGVGNRIYEEVRKQNTDNTRNRVHEYRSGGITVDCDPPAWTKSRSQSKSNQTAIRNRQIRNAQIEQRNQEIREQNRIIEEQRRLDEELREAERQERIRQRKQQLFNEGYTRSIICSARSFERKMQKLDQMEQNMEYIRNNHQLDGLPRLSGYIPSDGETVNSNPRKKTSLAGIVPKEGKPAVTGLDFHAVPVTAIKDDAYYYEWEKLEIPQPTPVSLPTDAVQALKKLQENCSENKFVMLKHEIIRLNDGSVPKFLGYNDAGNAVFEAEKKIYSITPNGDRIFFMSLDEKDEGLISNYLDGRNVMDFNVESKGLGHTANLKYELKNKEEPIGTIMDDKTTELSYSNVNLEAKYKNETIKNNISQNFTPSLSASAKIKWLDDASTGKVNYIRIGENSIHEFNASLSGGTKIEANANLDVNPGQQEKERVVNDLLKKSGIELQTNGFSKKESNLLNASADISLETVSASVGYAYKRIKSVAGQKYLVSYSIGGGGGHKLSPTTYKTFGLYAKAFLNYEIEPIDNDDVLLPINNTK